MKALIGWKLYAIIGVLIIGMLAAIYLWGRAGGKGLGETTKPIDLPGNGSGIPDGWSALAVAKSLHSAMSGWTYSFPKVKSKLSGLTDDQLAAVYNEFNNQYLSEGEGDLFQWFADETSWSQSNMDYIEALFNGVI